MENSWEFYHVAVVVQDMDKAVEYYKSLGATVGTPRFPSEFYLDSSTYLDYEVHGKSPDTLHKTKVLLVNMAGLVIELIQPLEGETVYKEFLDNRGEGIHHIAFYVDDLEEETAKLVRKGFPVITKVKRAKLSSFAYCEFGNVIIELLHVPEYVRRTHIP